MITFFRRHIIEKPILRGHSHQAAFFVGLGACALLLPKSKDSETFWANLIYSICLLSMFGLSALYHRPTWTKLRVRHFMGQLDQCGIFLMIAGSFTPISLTLDDATSRKVLTIIWSVAFIGIVASFIGRKIKAPKWALSVLYVIVGWLMLPYLPELGRTLTEMQLSLIVLGGVLYTIGALVYGLKWPVLNPRYFGYHEVFHLLVVFGALVHFIVIYQIT